MLKPQTLMLIICCRGSCNVSVHSSGNGVGARNDGSGRFRAISIKALDSFKFQQRQKVSPLLITAAMAQILAPSPEAGRAHCPISTLLFCPHSFCQSIWGWYSIRTAYLSTFTETRHSLHLPFPSPPLSSSLTPRLSISEDW